MKTLITSADLNIKIQLLEHRQKAEQELLQEQLLLTYEKLKPVNLIKSTFNELASPLIIKDKILSTTMGITAGYISKLILVGATGNPLKKALGALLQFGISTLVAKNPETIKLADAIITLLSKRKNKKKETHFS